MEECPLMRSRRLPAPLRTTNLLGAFAASLTFGALPAQQPAGLLVGMPPAKVGVSSISTPVNSELLMRVPGEAYRGIGAFVAGQHRVRGAEIWLLDNSLSDGGTFDVHVYLEQGNTNLPTIVGSQPPGTTAIFSAVGLTTPQGISEHVVQVLFGNGVQVPIGSDLFVSVVHRGGNLSLRTVAGTRQTGFSATTFDACGTGMDPNDAFAYLHDQGFLGPLGSGLVGWQGMMELLVDGSSGVAVSRRSANLPGTASMYSGLHPDSAFPSNQPSRADQPGYVFLANGAIAEGSPVFLLGSVMPFASGPWIVLSPGDAVLHLSPFGLVGLGFAATAMDGRAEIYWQIPHTAAIRGLEVRSQAFGLDLGTGVVAAGAATRQRF